MEKDAPIFPAGPVSEQKGGTRLRRDSPRFRLGQKQNVVTLMPQFD